MVAALALGALPAAAAAQSGDPLPGYTEAGSTAQRAYEERFSAGVSAETIGAVSRRLASRPQRVGTPGARRTAEISVQRLRRVGLNARLAP